MWNVTGAAFACEGRGNDTGGHDDPPDGSDVDTAKAFCPEIMTKLVYVLVYLPALLKKLLCLETYKFEVLRKNYPEKAVGPNVSRMGMQGSVWGSLKDPANAFRFSCHGT